MGIFADLDLGQIQRILFPVIESLGGPDLESIIEDKGKALEEAGDVLFAAAELLHLAGRATDDGIITNEEIDAIVTAAPTVSQAVENLFRVIQGDDAMPE